MQRNNSQSTIKDNLDMTYLEKAREIQTQMSAWRRDFHAHPELGFQEQRTAAIVAETLRSFGLQVQTGIGRTGVVGRLGSGSPVIAIRADMDALPIQETSQTAYASQNSGMMHACGHDAHTAILLGTARLFAEMPDRPAGEIRFLFQPCEEGSVCADEEGLSGAPRMIEDGALDGVDAVIALHVASEAPVGIVIIDEGFVSAAVDTFEAKIIGEGCHGAYPHHGIDPIFLLGQVITSVQGIRSRRLDPMKPAVVTIASVHAGDAPNAIPEIVELSGTIRTFDAGIREQIHKELEGAFSVCRALGGNYELTIKRGSPAGSNDPRIAEAIRAVSSRITGPEKTIRYGPSMGGEDFAYMCQKAPGAMFHLGARIADENRPHHSPIFDIDEDSFPIGAAIFIDTVCHLLNNPQIYRGEEG